MEPNMSGAGAKRILIVDDHAVVRFGLRQLIDEEPDLQVCGEASGATEGARLIEKLLPDLAIIDLSLGDGSGLELIQTIRSAHPSVKTLVVSMHDDYVYAQRALRAGAKGYINKTEAIGRVVEAIRRIFQGRIFLTETMTERALAGMAAGEDPQQGMSVDQLTNRELEVFEMIGEGGATRDIAARLHLSVKTIESHRANIKAKLGLGTSQELTRRAVEWVMRSRNAPGIE